MTFPINVHRKHVGPPKVGSNCSICGAWSENFRKLCRSCQKKALLPTMFPPAGIPVEEVMALAPLGCKRAAFKLEIIPDTLRGALCRKGLWEKFKAGATA